MSANIDVWHIDLAAVPGLDACLAVLDAGERHRAERFRVPELGRRFAAAHCAMRHILGERLGMPARDVAFAASAHGKPFLPGSGMPVFNLSHSHEMALLAVAASGEIGVDVEHCRDLEHGDLARRYFSAAEAQALAALPEALRRTAFFACWTRKEAYIKAKGLGLSLDLASFAVTLGDAPALGHSEAFPEDPARFRVWDVPVPGGYRAALAHAGDAPAALRHRVWP